MPNTHPNPKMLNFDRIQHPMCSTCGTPMVLILIAPDKPGFDQRTFECRQCEISESFVIAVSS